MSTLFISHSSKDRAIATRLKHRLDREGHIAFLDFDPDAGIPASAHWENHIYAELSRCQAVVVLLTRHALASRWCFAEIAMAKSLGKPVFALKMVRQIPPIVGSVQVIDWMERDRWRRLSRGLQHRGLTWTNQRPPYPGLLAFEEDDAPVFFGREAEIAAGLELVRRAARGAARRLLLVIGPSGSGKSSILRAGLIPQLRGDSSQWIVLPPIRPALGPYAQLAGALIQAFGGDVTKARLGEIENGLGKGIDGLTGFARELLLSTSRLDSRVLIALDQMEEILSSKDGDSFLSMLRAAVGDPASRISVVATLRSDFLAPLQGHEQLRGLEFETLMVSPMPVERFEEVIAGPARVAGVEIEAGLTGKLIAETKRPDALPLLAIVLHKLWKRAAADARQSEAVPKLRTSVYDELGGLAGAMAQIADSLTATMTVHDEETLRSSFLCLVQVSGHAYLRRPALWSDLPSAAHPLLQKFVDERLLVSRDDRGERLVEVAHETIFTSWRPLAEWLSANRERLQKAETLNAAASQWNDGGRDADLLVHRGDRLAAAEQLMADGRVPLESVVHDYLAAGIAAREAARAEEERQQRRLRDANRMTAFNATLDRSVRAALLREVEDPIGTRGWMEAAATTLREPPWHFSVPHPAAVRLASVAFNEHATVLLGRTGGPHASNLLMWKVGEVGLPQMKGASSASLFWTAYDARLERALALWSDGKLHVFTIELGPDLMVNGVLDSIEQTPSGEKAHFQNIQKAATEVIDAFHGDFDRDRDTVIASGYSTRAARLVTCHRNGVVRTWDVKARRTPVVIGKIADANSLRALVVSPGGNRALTLDDRGELRVFSLDVGDMHLPDETILGSRSPFEGFRVATFDDRGQYIAAGRDDGNLIVHRWGDTGPEAMLGVKLSERDHVTALAFAPGRLEVLAGTSRGALVVWPFDESGVIRDKMPAAFSAIEALYESDRAGIHRFAQRTEDPRPLPSHANEISAILFNDDGSRALTLSIDGMALLWNGDLAHAPTLLQRSGAGSTTATFSPDGAWVALMSPSGTFVWPASAVGDPMIVVPPPWVLSNFATAVAFESALSDRLSIRWGNHTGTCDVGDLAPAETTDFSYYPRKGFQSSTSFEGSNWRVHMEDGQEPLLFPILSVAVREPIVLGGFGSDLKAIDFASDIGRIVGVTSSGDVALWNAGDPVRPAWVRRRARISAATFVGDGQRLILGRKDGVVELWDSATGAVRRSLGRVSMSGMKPGAVRSVAVSEDETWFLAATERDVCLLGSIDEGPSTILTGDFHLVRGNSVAIGVQSGSVYLINHALEQRVVRALDADPTSSVEVVSPDGRWFATRAKGHLRVWSTRADVEPLELPAAPGVRQSGVSRDGSLLAIAGPGDQVQVWRIDVDPESLKSRLWAATPYCLTAEQRQTFLGEPPETASKNRRAALACALRAHA